MAQRRFHLKRRTTALAGYIKEGAQSLVNTEIQIMKIYDIVEGKWLTEKEAEEIKKEDHKKFDLRLRLITYDEEKDWLKREKNLSSQ